MRCSPPVQTDIRHVRESKGTSREGEAAKWARHQRVMATIRQGITFGSERGFEAKCRSGLVAAVRYPDDPAWDFEKVHDYCYERGFTIYRGAGTFRLCALALSTKTSLHFGKFRAGACRNRRFYTGNLYRIEHVRIKHVLQVVMPVHTALNRRYS